jgi:hypothetical protein
MKLTKGKLSKIQNKKKQSLKRYKKGGKTHKSKTFRKRKHLNLHNTTLKKYKGGQAKVKPVASETESSETKPLEPEPLTQLSQEVQPLPEESQQPVEQPEESQQPVEQLEESQQPARQSEEEQQTVELPLETPNQEPISSNPGEGPGSHQELPSPVSEEGSETANNNLDNSDTGSDTESLVDMGSIAEPPKLEEEPIAQANSVPSIAAESLDNLIDYISEKIASKLKQSSSSGTDLNRDSFNSVATASETLAEA